MGLDRWLGGQELLLFSWKTMSSNGEHGVQFPVPTSGGSQLLVTPVSAPSPGLLDTRTHVYKHTQFQIKINLRKINLKRSRAQTGQDS